RLHVQAEVRDWIPFAGTDYEGNVLRYGIGAGYRVVQTCRYWFGPVAELIGWTALSGKETVVDDFGVVTTQKASGDTIVNASLGVRLGLGDATQSGLLNQSDFFIGYSHSLTGEVWTKDMVRVEVRLRF